MKIPSLYPVPSDSQDRYPRDLGIIIFRTTDHAKKHNQHINLRINLLNPDTCKQRCHNHDHRKMYVDRTTVENRTKNDNQVNLCRLMFQLPVGDTDLSEMAEKEEQS